MEVLDGNFYLIARYYDNSYKIIKLNLKKYLKLESDCFQKKNDIAFIDYKTINYNSKEELKLNLYKDKVIVSKDIDLYIVHPVKYNDKTYLKEFNVLCNIDDDIKKHLINVMDNRLKKLDISKINYDIKYIGDKFLSKISYNNTFFKFIISPSTKIDKQLKVDLLKYKNNNSNYMYYYLYNNCFNSYINLRNIVVIMNEYENLIKKIDYQTEEELYRNLINIYEDEMNKNSERKLLYYDLVKSINSNYVENTIVTNDYEEKEDDLEFLSEEEISSMTNYEGYTYLKKKTY